MKRFVLAVIGILKRLLKRVLIATGFVILVTIAMFVLVEVMYNVGRKEHKDRVDSRKAERAAFAASAASSPASK